jgi:hypothetical protein
MAAAKTAGMNTVSDAAAFVRSRLQAGARISQEEMAALISDLKEAMGRALTAAEVNAVVDVFQDVLMPMMPAPAEVAVATVTA